MYENPPASYPPPPAGPGLGCFAKGCLTVLAVGVLLGVMFGAGVWYTARNVMPFLSDKPVDVRVFPATDAQYQDVRARVAPFIQAVNAGQAGSLTLSADDLNILIARDPAFAALRGRAYLAVDHNAMTAETSFRINDAGPGQQQVYFNGKVDFDASYAAGDFAFVVRRVEPPGGGPTPSLVAWTISRPNFSRDVSRFASDKFHDTLNRDNPAGAAFFNRVRTMIIQNNEIVVTATGAADAVPVAAPTNPP